MHFLIKIKESMKRKYEDTETLRKANMDLLDIKVSIRIS